jgi:hypothetical protein
LSLLLRAGSLSVPIEIIEERTIGPSLGADNIAKGVPLNSGSVNDIFGSGAFFNSLAIFGDGFYLVFDKHYRHTMVQVFGVVNSALIF